MPTLEYIRSEIERMRVQIGRQRKEILQLQRAGIGTASAEALLSRMQAKVDDLCAQRDQLKKVAPPETRKRVLVNGARNLLRSGAAKFPSWRDGDQPST
ncbi:hypothetical protein [Bradyrhizobium vignae]|uniref:hypothetical protein n=1 Tax=Bradyrhizobium vignae TaxID=1549949 RepID=UPI00100BBF58|nr:hypothetical protein [Bradyrhizobium vignae]RXG86228.1 hypothetical protein EAV90_34150 [Bradyrhizobium vignae]